MRFLNATVVAAVLLVGCTGASTSESVPFDAETTTLATGVTETTGQPSTSVTSAAVDVTTTTPATAEDDPFLTWIAAGGAEMAAAEGLNLDAAGAMARAYLGCGTDWPVGSLDHLLAVIYRDVPVRFDFDGLPHFDGGAGSVAFCDAPA